MWILTKTGGLELEKKLIIAIENNKLICHTPATNDHTELDMNGKTGNDALKAFHESIRASDERFLDWTK